MTVEREFGESLFERIGEAARPSSLLPPKVTLLQSVMLSLQNILNTRCGSCYGSPELGLPDLNNETFSSMNIRDITTRAISDCILRYEPRISDATISARVRDENSPLELCFHILANVNFNSHQDVLEFDVLLDNSQRWRVEK